MSPVGQKRDIRCEVIKPVLGTNSRG